MRKATVKAILRVALSSFYLLAAILLQCGLFPHFRLFGAIPCVALCAVICISVYENERVSCIMAVCAGFIADTAGGGDFTYSPLTFLLAAAVTILLSRRLLRRGIQSAALSAFIAFVCDAVICTALLLLRGASPVGSILLHTALPQILYSCIVLLPVFVLTRMHYRIFGISKSSNEHAG